MSGNIEGPTGGEQEEVGDKVVMALHSLLPQGGWQVCYGLYQNLPRMLIVTRDAKSLLVVGGWDMEAFRHFCLLVEKNCGHEVEVREPTLDDFLRGSDGSSLPLPVSLTILEGLKQLQAKEKIKQDARGYVSLCWSGGAKVNENRQFGPIARFMNERLEARGYRECNHGCTNEPRNPDTLEGLCEQFGRDLRLPSQFGFRVRPRVLPSLAERDGTVSESTHYSPSGLCACADQEHFEMLQLMADLSDVIHGVDEVAQEMFEY